MKKQGVSKTVLLVFLISVFSLNLSADVNKPVKWQKTIEDLGNGIYEISFSAKIDAGWHLYGLVIPDGGPYATTFNYNDSSIFNSIEKPISTHEPERKFDETFDMVLELFSGSVTFKQKVKLKDKSAKITGYIEFMACDNATCLPPTEDEFEFIVGSKSVAQKDDPEKKEGTEKPLFQNNKLDLGSSDKEKAEEINAIKTSEGSSAEVVEIKKGDESESPIEPENNETEKSLWRIFLEALSKGIIAIFTPCVFPIIPLTVAFFMRDNTPTKRIFQALFFGFSLIAIYASVGLIAGIFQIDLTEMTKNWIANVIIASILIAFAISFFGVFELVLPSKLSTKLDSQVDNGGLLAPFFLALVTAVVSFSCVGPIAGVAIGAAMNGEIISPVIAMIGFSAAFALPFVLIGIFPGLLKNMPKSGGWLNSVKVFFAFIMVIASFIFLGNTQWGIFNRDVILSLNIVTFFLLGYYLLGKIKFSHDSDIPHISVPRLFLAILSFAVAIYLVPGLFGSPLKAFTPFLPPQETSGFQLASGSGTAGNSISNEISNQKLCDESPKYADKLHLPYNLLGYFDYNEALACAKETNTPVLIDFVGHTCKNCKKMYAEVWSDKAVQKKLSDEFVLLALYTDDRTKLPEEEWITSTFDGRVKKTLGKKNLDFQLSRFNSNALPMYVIVDPEGNIITKSKKYYTYNNDVNAFLEFLEEGLQEYK